ncbi:MAG: hypothetical protein HeimC3_44730 [Candidatus Heimdallarchaeota archaeon LC_3]|nr:MAG: hypothetical protein HeimC3_44730 [Candidatus Heimdallarchaeota archaeon LC_3]
MSNNDALKKMSKYILNGAKMLQVSCPNCNIPLIQEKNSAKIFCANCLKEAQYVQNKEEAEKLEEKISLEQSSKPILSELESILIGKLQLLSTQIATETNLDQLENILKVNLKLMKNIALLSKLKKKFNKK